MVALNPMTPTVAELERDTLHNDWEHPEDRVTDTRGRPARSFGATETAVPRGIVRSMDFPTSKMLRVAALEINKDIADELNARGAQPLQIARVRRYTEFDRITARLVATLPITGEGQKAEITNEVIDAFRAVLHEPTADAMYQAGIQGTFALEHCDCSRTKVVGRMKRIIAAAGCKYDKAWDEIYT